MSDFMELGNGLVSLADGWFLDVATGNRIDPDGKVYDQAGELIYDPEKEDD